MREMGEYILVEMVMVRKRRWMSMKMVGMMGIIVAVVVVAVVVVVVVVQGV